MWLKGLKEGISFSFSTRSIRYLRTKVIDYLLSYSWSPWTPHSMNLKYCSVKKKDDPCGKDFLKTLKEAIVHKAKHWWTAGNKRTEKYEVSLKSKWPLMTSCLAGLDSTEGKLIFAPCMVFSINKKFNQRLRELVAAQGNHTPQTLNVSLYDILFKQSIFLISSSQKDVTKM